MELGAFLKNTDKFYAIADSGVFSLARLAASIALANLAGTTAFAQYVLLTSASVILSTLISTRYMTPVITVATGLQGTERLKILNLSGSKIRSITKRLLIVSLFTMPIAAYSGLNLWLYSGFIAATASGLDLLFQRAALQSLFKMKKAFIYDCTAIFITFICLFLFWHLMKIPEIGYWWGLALGSSVSASMMKRSYSDKPAMELTEGEHIEANMDKVNRMGKAMLIGSFANSVCSRVQPFSISAFTGPLAVAQFGAAWTLIGPMRMLSGALSSILRPRFALKLSRNEPETFYRMIIKVYCLIVATGSLGILAACLTAPFFITRLFGENLSGAAWLLPPALAYATVDSLTTIQMVAIQTRYDNGASIASRLRIQAAVISIICLIPACIYFGAAGAVGSLLLPEIYYAIRATRILHSKQDSTRTL